MSVEQYFVLQSHNEWKIIFKDKHYGPYDAQQEASGAAFVAAYAMGQIGIVAQVLIHAADQKLGTAWSYGQDL
jgi:hypothetical protein